MNLLPRIILPVVVLASLVHAAEARADEPAPVSAPLATSAPEKAFAPEGPDPNAVWTHGVALRVGLAATIVGSLAVPAGAVVFVAGNLRCEDADCTDPVKKGIGIAMIAAGGVSLASGVVILATMPKDKEPSRPAARLTMRPGGVDLRVTF